MITLLEEKTVAAYKFVNQYPAHFDQLMGLNTEKFTIKSGKIADLSDPSKVVVFQMVGGKPVLSILNYNLKGVLNNIQGIKDWDKDASFQVYQ